MVGCSKTMSSHKSTHIVGVEHDLSWLQKSPPVNFKKLMQCEKVRRTPFRMTGNSLQSIQSFSLTVSDNSFLRAEKSLYSEVQVKLRHLTLLFVRS